MRMLQSPSKLDIDIDATGYKQCVNKEGLSAEGISSIYFLSEFTVLHGNGSKTSVAYIISSYIEITAGLYMP
jgi:hypothetical protein